MSAERGRIGTEKIERGGRRKTEKGKRGKRGRRTRRTVSKGRGKRKIEGRRIRLRMIRPRL